MKKTLQQGVMAVALTIAAASAFATSSQPLTPLNVPMADLHVPMTDLKVPMADLRVPAGDIRLPLTPLNPAK